MAFPTISLDVQFTGGVWTNIAADLLSFSTFRGRQSELDQMQAGTAQFVLKNTHGNYWAASGTYANVKPGRIIRLGATYGGTTYGLFRGRIERFRHGFLGASGDVPIVTIEAADPFKFINLYSPFQLAPPGFTWPQEASGTRIKRLFFSILAWPFSAWSPDPPVGVLSVQATGNLKDVNFLEHIQNCVEAEGGLFFSDGVEQAVFQDRNYRSGLASSATFSDSAPAAGTQYYADLEIEHDELRLYNTFAYTRIGGSTQSVSDATSQATYGVRRRTLVGTWNVSDADVLTRANEDLARYKDPKERVAAITLKPERDPTNLWPKALGYELSTKITVVHAPSAINAAYYVEAIEHQGTARPKTWQTRWTLSPA